MLDDIRSALIITRREIRDQIRDWRIILPIAVLTLIFPFLANFTTRRILDFVQKYGANLLAERFIPFLLMIVGFFPISISLVIALESFSGETERRSIEPLLSSPLTDGQLYLGKLVACIFIPLFASYLGMSVYLVGIYNNTTWRADPMFLFLIIILTAVQALVMVCGAVVISTQTTSVRAANLLASFIIIPVALLIQVESVMMLYADYRVLWWAVLGLAILTVLLIRMGITHLNREELLGHEIDTLNLRWMWSVFRRQFVGSAHTPWDWYGQEIPLTLRKMALPLAWMTLLLAAVVGLGAVEVKQLGLTPGAFGLERLKIVNEQMLGQFRQLGFFSTSSVLTIWWHNLRAVSIAAVLGSITLGVAGVLILLLPMGIIGFFTGAASLTGLSPLAVLAAFTMPHGLLEIPAIILSGAAILRVGASFESEPGLSIGEGLVISSPIGQNHSSPGGSTVLRCSSIGGVRQPAVDD
jgi:ABC-type transport system involved in multi-copper enzyme maturation permease subunit